MPQVANKIRKILPKTDVLSFVFIRKLLKKIFLDEPMANQLKCNDF
jgi:hypothetical protein